MRDADTSEIAGGNVIQRLFRLASVLSLVLCVALVVLWRRSYKADESIEFIHGGHLCDVRISAGTMTLSNAPQVQMEDALIDQRKAGLWRATERVDVLLDRLDTLRSQPSQLPGEDSSESLKRAEEAANLTTEEIYAELALYKTDQMSRLPMARTPPFARSVRCRAVLAISAIPWLALTLSPTWVRLRAARRGRRGQCLACGYDLRASVDRCPECGNIVRLAAGASR